MSIINRRNAVLGYAALKVGRPIVRRRIQSVGRGGSSVRSRTGIAFALTAMVAVVSLIAAHKKRSDDDATSGSKGTTSDS